MTQVSVVRLFLGGWGVGVSVNVEIREQWKYQRLLRRKMRGKEWWRWESCETLAVGKASFSGGSVVHRESKAYLHIQQGNKLSNLNRYIFSQFPSTYRDSNIATSLTSPCCKLNLLSEDYDWTFFCNLFWKVKISSVTKENRLKKKPTGEVHFTKFRYRGAALRASSWKAWRRSNFDTSSVSPFRESWRDS